MMTVNAMHQAGRINHRRWKVGGQLSDETTDETSKPEEDHYAALCAL
jgi:hypothetical protein